MIIKPVMTEKSMNEAKNGKYSFWVPKSFTKYMVRKMVGEAFGVTVKNVKTLTYKESVRKNVRGRKVTTSARKKAIVTLKAKEKIDLFETKSK